MKPVLKIALIAGCSWGLGSLWAAPVDFTPRPFVTELDGVKFQDIKFIQGGQEICYRPLQGWVASGSPEVARFRPDSESAVRVEFTHSDGTSAPAWDEEGVKDLRQRAMAVLPPVQELKLLSELRSPLQMNGHATIAFTYSGVLFSQKYKIYLLLLPLESEQFNFFLYAPEKDFDKASKLFLSSLFGLQWK